MERREASIPDGVQGARWRLRAYVTGPPKGAAAPERLSALRFPLCEEGNIQTSEGLMPRENEEVCVGGNSVARLEMSLGECPTGA